MATPRGAKPDRGRHQPRQRAGDHLRRHAVGAEGAAPGARAGADPAGDRARHDDTDLDILKAAGATEVVPEALEGSLMLASHALVMMGVPLRRVVHRVQAARDERYASLRGYFHGASDVGDPEHTYVRLHSVTLNDDARSAIGKMLGEFGAGRSGAEVTASGAARREPDEEVPPGHRAGGTGDVVVLRGDGRGWTPSHRAEGACSAKRH
jgi:CPA2 family monovalent cation:H+ antiporter-2